MSLPKLLTGLGALRRRVRAMGDDLWTVSVVARAAETSTERLPNEVWVDDAIESALGQLGVTPVLVVHASRWYGVSFVMPTYEATREDVVKQALNAWQDLVVKASLPDWDIWKFEVCRGEVRPNVAPSDADPRQAWYWTPEWHAGQREAERELEAGRARHFDSEEDFFAFLR